MLGIMESAALNGFLATKVRVEVDISRGLPAFHLVGLAENSVKEARVRVQSAITNSGFEFPRAKICVNLAPADLQKNGTGFDLAIALAILQADAVIAPIKLKGLAAIGELSLTGEIMPVRGVLVLAEAIKEQGFSTLIVAMGNAREASLISGLTIKIARTLGEMVTAINKETVASLPSFVETDDDNESEHDLDMRDVVGQEEARRALLIAAAGRHNIVFIGGPGSGKSMMAHRMPTILPPLSYEESIILTKIHSVAGLTMSGKLMTKRPFRSPHHSITRAGLVGGGSKIICPGEISLACFGVLFLDEFLEFPRAVLEMLRQPLEDKKITLSRASTKVTFPAEVALIAALNPCPCGNLGQKLPCTCSPLMINRYQSRLSGPLIDRIDLHVNVPPVELIELEDCREGESSESMRKNVIRARRRQTIRFSSDLSNGMMTRSDIKNYALVTKNAFSFLLKASERLSISARGFDRIIKVARTVADLEDSIEVHEEHISEALHYRPSSLALRIH